MLNSDQALAFIERHGVVLVSAQGALPRLTEAIAGEPIRGSWWGHPRGKHIFTVLRALEDSPDLLMCRLVGDKVTLVHRRLWPALVRCAARIGPERLSRIREKHTESGKHETIAIAFPEWVPRAIAQAAERMDEAEAAAELGFLFDAIARKRSAKPRSD
jgi:hypothetical protein